MNHNQVELYGHIGNISVFDEAKDKKPFASAFFATRYRYRNKTGGVAEKSAWHNLVFFGNLVAEAKRTISSGTRLFVIGQLDYQDLTDAHGQKRTTAIIKVAKFFVLDDQKRVKVPAQTEEEVMCSNLDEGTSF